MDTNYNYLYPTEKETLIMNSISEGVVYLSTDFDIIWHNDKVMDFYNLDSPSFGKKCYSALSGRNSPCSICPLRNAIDSSEDSHVRKILNSRHYDYLCHPIIKDGVIIGAVESITDITSHIEIQEKLENTNKIKSEFFANMSHEIRTPLNAIIGFSDLLSMMNLSDKQKTYIQAINQSGKGLLDVINDILDLSKIEAGKLEVQYKEVNLIDLFQEIKSMFSIRLDENNIKLNVNIDANVPSGIILDQARLKQLLINIVGNAVKFTHKGSITISVSSKLNEIDGTIGLHFKVSDTGIGIKPENLENIFDQYQQQKNQDQDYYPGTGLGLSISKNIVELMNGAIYATSEVNVGSTFHIDFYDVEFCVMDSTEVAPLVQNHSLLNGKSLLVVDDIESNRMLLEEIIEGSGGKVYLAVDGKDGVEKASKLLPDIIIMDIRMPVMNGIDATKLIKAQESTSKIPIIALTASIKPEEINKIQNIFDDYLTKPVSIAALYRSFENFTDYVPPVTSDADIQIKDPISDLPQLILPDELISLLDDCIDLLIMDEIKHFTREVLNIAKDLNDSALNIHANNLNRYINTFDFSSLEEELTLIRKLAVKR